MEHAENKHDLYFGPFRIDRLRRALWRGDAAVELSPTEFDVLLTLVEGRGAALGTESLRNTVWHGVAVEVSNVYQVIRRLRQKLGPDETGNDYVVRTREGYLLAEEVATTPTSPEENGHRASMESAPNTFATAPINDDKNRKPASSPPSPIAPASSEPSGQKQRRTARRWPISTLINASLAGLLTMGFVFFLSRPNFVPPMVQLTRDGRPKIGPLLFDRKRIWFQEWINGRKNIVSVAATGGEPQSLNLPLNEPDLLGLTADRSAILLLSNDASDTKLWSWSLLGGGLQSLPANASEDGWSPDRQTMAFSRDNTLVFISRGREISRAMMPAGTRVYRPQWSPDGTHIAFELVNSRLALTSLQLVDPSTGQSQPIAQPSNVGEDQQLGAWTRDGRYYVFAAGTPELHDLWAISSSAQSLRADQTRPMRVTNGPLNWIWPTPGNRTSELYAIGESWRGELVSLASGSRDWRPYLGGISAYELDHSLDGKWVAYVHYPDHRLWVARVDGTDAVQMPWPDFEAHQPHWSPDGSRLAFMGKPRDKWRVMVLQIATRRGFEPVPDGEDQGVPTWLKDGRLVFGDWPTSSPHQVMRLHVLDVGQRKSSVLPGSEKLWTVRCSPDGNYLAALCQDSKALLLSRSGSSDWRQVLSGDDLDGPTWSPDSRYIFLTGSRCKELLRVCRFS